MILSNIYGERFLGKQLTAFSAITLFVTKIMRHTHLIALGEVIAGYAIVLSVATRKILQRYLALFSSIVMHLALVA